MPDFGTARVKRRLAGWQARSRRIDHLVRAVGRYGEVQAGQLAGAVTYFGFLSFFPLLAVAFAVLAWVVRVDPSVRARVDDLLVQNLPGIVGHSAGQIDISKLASTSAGVGVLGLAGLLYAGLGWLEALRAALREVYGFGRTSGSMVARKSVDIVILAVLGGAVILTVSISTLATSVTTQVLGHIGLDDSLTAILTLKVLALALSVAADALLLMVIFGRLPGRRGDHDSAPWRDVASGAVLGSLLLQVLKVTGAYLVARTTSNPVYGAFALAVGLLVWLNFVCRAILFAASWSATVNRTPDGSGARSHTDAAGPRSGRGRLAALAGVAVLLRVRRRGSAR